MIKQVCITDASGPRFYTHADFPLAIGSQPGTDILIESDIASEAIAFLIIIVNRTYIEAGNKSALIRINNEQISGQQELQHDDFLQIENTTFHCEHIGDTFSISLYDDQDHIVAKNHELASHGELIEPITLPNDEAKMPKKNKLAQLLLILGTLFFVFLALVIGYIFTAKSLLIEIEPRPDSVALSGKVWPLKIKQRYLVQPGKYELDVTKSGYYPLHEEIKVTHHQSQSLAFALKKKPGYLHITSVPSDGVQITIDEKEYGTTPLEQIELDAGSYSLEASIENYQLYTTQLVIEGKDQNQQLEINLLPNWAEVTINSKPIDAEVWINGVNKGTTPLSLDLQAGNYSLELRHPDYLAYTTDFLVLANEPLELPVAELFSNPSHLVITSSPSKANVLLAGELQGITPLTIRLNPNTEHLLTLSMPGFRDNQQIIALKPGEQSSLSAKLEPILGTVIFTTEPADSEVFVNGKYVGSGEVKLSLPSNTHRIEIRKSGYEVFEKMVTPTANTPQVFDVKLHRITSVTTTDKPTLIRTSQGQELTLIIGGNFSMGAARREQGRRSNETQHMVDIQRPFYISVAEVTNEQFSEFMDTHNSGSYKGNDLSAPNLPVVNISWDDAARYCNWLSEKEGLEKALSGKKMVKWLQYSLYPVAIDCQPKVNGNG